VVGLLSRRPEIRQDLLIKLLGSASRHIEQLIEERGLGDVVSVTGHVSHREAIQVMQTSDVLLLLQTPVAGRHLSVIPAKLFEYMGARKPILAVSTEGDSARIVRDHRLGIVVDPASPRAIGDAVDELYRRFKEGSLAVEDDPPDEYCRLELSRQLAGLLHRLADCARVKND